MPNLSLSLLGPFQAALDGQPITGFDSNKVRALLAYLAVEADRPHARDELIGLLWPEQPDATARAICVPDEESAATQDAISASAMEIHRLLIDLFFMIVLLITNIRMFQPFSCNGKSSLHALWISVMTK